MSVKQGYGITTRKLRLRCSHPQWLSLTQEFYNQIETFYCDLLLAQEKLWGKSSQEILRDLEQLSLPGRERRTPRNPLPWEKVPPYFRRAAANAGIAAAKSFLSQESSSSCDGEGDSRGGMQSIESSDIYGKRSISSLNSSVVYYKGMYRDFSENGITLKVWTGEGWTWMHCRLYGNKFPENGQLLSPTVVLEKDFLMLHVPVKEPNSDGDSVKSRMKQGKNICGLQFTNTDAFAVGSVMDGEGKELALRFFGGGKEYSHYCRMVLEKLDKSRRSLGTVTEGKPNQRHWMHLKNLSEHYAHGVSRDIVLFCQEWHVSVIALPKYDREYSWNVMVGSGDWSPLHLSMKIRKYLSYKAWMAGMIVIEVNARRIGSVCSVCGGAIAETDKKSGRIVCVNGHSGNRYLNAARNLGRKCREQFRE